MKGVGSWQNVSSFLDHSWLNLYSVYMGIWEYTLFPTAGLLMSAGYEMTCMGNHLWLIINDALKHPELQIYWHVELHHLGPITHWRPPPPPCSVSVTRFSLERWFNPTSVKTQWNFSHRVAHVQIWAGSLGWPCRPDLGVTRMCYMLLSNKTIISWHCGYCILNHSKTPSMFVCFFFIKISLLKFLTFQQTVQLDM